MGTLLLSGWSVALAQTDSTATEKGATLAAAPVAVSAPTETVSKAKEEPKISVKPTGRILFDAALFAPKNQKDLFNDGFGVPDARVGVAAIDTSVSATDKTAYCALCRGATDHAHDRAHQATKRHVVVGKRRSNSERPEVRKSTTNDTSRISIGTSEPMSPKMPRTPLPAKPTKNIAATV